MGAPGRAEKTKRKRKKECADGTEARDAEELELLGCNLWNDVSCQCTF